MYSRLGKGTATVQLFFPDGTYCSVGHGIVAAARCLLAAVKCRWSYVIAKGAFWNAKRELLDMS